MRKVPLVPSLRLIGRGSLNWLAERPIVVSFEVTDACTCWCRHCDHGGPRDESRNLKPAEYTRYLEALAAVTTPTPLKTTTSPANTTPKAERASPTMCK